MHKVLNPERFKEIKSRIRQRQKKLTGYAGTVLVESGTPLDNIPVGVKITTSLHPKTNAWEIHLPQDGKNGLFGKKDVKELAIKLKAIAYID
tara:strand:+ start:247 stop:522 length:276 start_codon:yes stop_codon:yes gene_type:complete